MARIRPRLYDSILAWHLERYRQMVFVSGPRQVGKTTTCRKLGDAYLNIDDMDHRAAIMAGPASLAARIGLTTLRAGKPVLVLDELHRWKKWKAFLKGFFDTYEARLRIVVTGSSRLDVYRRGGDSLMGRYFPYRMHPFSVAEVARQAIPRRFPSPPAAIPAAEFRALWRFGGYPEPFIRRDPRHHLRWLVVRNQQLLRGDLRDLTQVQELAQIETFAGLLERRSATRLVYSNLAGIVNTSVDTARRWVRTLAALYHGFLVRPWHRRIARSLRKEPKWYLRDWSGIQDTGARAETFIACHLLKAVEGWTDLGLGSFALGYLRDKEQREVDFVVARDRKPWFLVEVKSNDDTLRPALKHFQDQLNAPFAFQVLLEADFVKADCFAASRRLLAVPAQTFLSQLL